MRVSPVVLMSAAAFALAACHHPASPVATAARVDNEKRCAELLIPSPGDSAYKQVRRPVLRSPVSVGGSQWAEYPLMARAHVDKGGNVDSVWIQAAGPYAQALQSRLFGARARPATYQGCAIAAWVTVDAS